MCFDGLWDMDARVQGKEFYKGGKLKYDGQWKGPHKHGKGVKYDYTTKTVNSSTKVLIAMFSVI
jgi:hypothetical protein